MKKLLAGILATTMVVGMSISVFGDAINDVNEEIKNEKAICDNKEDYTLSTYIFSENDGVIKEFFWDDGQLKGKIRVKDGKLIFPVDIGTELEGEDKLYFTIFVRGEEFDDDSKISDSYYYALKRSDVEDLTAKINASIGNNLVSKDAKIVKKNVTVGNDSIFSKKVYCVEVEVADYFSSDEAELEFDIVLKNNGHKETDTSSDNSKLNDLLAFTVGYDAEDLIKGEKAADNKSYVDVDKWSEDDGELELTVYEDSKAVKLECIGDDDIKNVYMQFDGVDATFDVKTSDQDPVYLGFNQNADKELIRTNEDADLTFLNFSANPTFDFSGAFTWAVPDSDKTYYLYENKDGELKQVGEYNDDDEAFVLRTRTLGNYVMSDEQLVIKEKLDDAEKSEDKSETVSHKNTPKVNVSTGAIL